MKKPYVLKKYHNMLIETGMQRVVEVLCRFPDKEFSLSDMAAEARVAKANIGNILEELHRIGFIRIEKLSKIWRIKSNQDGPSFIKYKITYNLNLIYQSGLVEYLNEYYKNPKAIILFGSFRKGEDVSGSDIDIAVETDEIDEYTITGLRELADIEKELDRKIQIHLFNRKNVDINVFNNIVNGIVLNGFLEAHP